MRRFDVILCCMVQILGASGCSRDRSDFVEGTGTIEGIEVDVSSEVPGKIHRIWMEEGAQVHKGDTLLQIDDTEFTIILRQALANMEATDAQYRLALSGARREDIVQAEALFKAAESDYVRMKELLASRSVTQKQYDDVYVRYVSAQQTYEKLIRGLRKEEILAAKAKRDQAVAQVDQAHKKVNDCTVRSPSDGTVTLRVFEPGESVALGSRLFRITNLTEVHLVIYINEVELGLVRVGQKASVFTDSFPENPFEGKVVFVSPIAEFTPKNVQTKEERTKLVFGVKLRIHNRSEGLKPGLPADARIHIAAEQHD